MPEGQTSLQEAMSRILGAPAGGNPQPQANLRPYSQDIAASFAPNTSLQIANRPAAAVPVAVAPTALAAATQAIAPAVATAPVITYSQPVPARQAAITAWAPNGAGGYMATPGSWTGTVSRAPAGTPVGSRQAQLAWGAPSAAWGALRSTGAVTPASSWSNARTVTYR